MMQLGRRDHLQDVQVLLLAYVCIGTKSKIGNRFPVLVGTRVEVPMGTCNVTSHGLPSIPLGVYLPLSAR